MRDAAARGAVPGRMRRTTAASLIWSCSHSVSRINSRSVSLSEASASRTAGPQTEPSLLDMCAVGSRNRACSSSASRRCRSARSSASISRRAVPNSAPVDTVARSSGGASEYRSLTSQDRARSRAWLDGNSMSVVTSSRTVAKSGAAGSSRSPSPPSSTSSASTGPRPVCALNTPAVAAPAPPTAPIATAPAKTPSIGSDEVSRPSGWQRFGATTPPLTSCELRHLGRGFADCVAVTLRPVLPTVAPDHVSSSKDACTLMCRRVTSPVIVSTPSRTTVTVRSRTTRVLAWAAAT